MSRAEKDSIKYYVTGLRLAPFALRAIQQHMPTLPAAFDAVQPTPKTAMDASRRVRVSVFSGSWLLLW
jgi:hypothetical protein